MKFNFTPDQSDFRKEIVGILDSIDYSKVLPTEPDGDPRPFYQLLAKHKLLGINWPKDVGGRAFGYVEAAMVSDELGRRRIPDTLHLLSIQVVGGLLLRHGNSEQKVKFLEPMSRGEIYASVLYTEPQAGSDMAMFRGHAQELSNGYFRINATKIFGLKTRYADYGLCALRTSDNSSNLEGFTLFMVPLDLPNVRITVIPTMQDEQFHLIELKDLIIHRNNVVGEIGQGWPLMIDALSLERTGMDYFIKARNWFQSLVRILSYYNMSTHGELNEIIGKLSIKLDVYYLYIWEILSQLDNQISQDSMLAISKWSNSELAKEIAYIASDILAKYDLVADGNTLFEFNELEKAYREAPGLTISGGASEIMLDTIMKDMEF